MAAAIVDLGVLGCGPRIDATGSGGGSEATTATESGMSDSSTHSGTGGSMSTEGTDGSTGGTPFRCELGEELIPRLCFERYAVELPGPIVGHRATGGNVDGIGGDELVVEVLLGKDQRLAVLAFERDVGTTLQQEVELTWHPDFEETTLFSADLGADGVDEVFRTMLDGLNECTADADGLLTCRRIGSSGTELTPAQPARLYDRFNSGKVYLISRLSDRDLDLGVKIYNLGGSLGTFAGASSPPCDDLVAVGHGDFTGDGFVDVVHRSSADCVDADDLRRDDLNLLLGKDASGMDIGPVFDAQVEPTSIAVLDADDDGFDDVLVHDAARGSAGYRWLHGTPVGFGEAIEATGPEGVDRLGTADLDADGPREVLYTGPGLTAVSRVPYDTFDAFDPVLGRLLTVADVDGDGRDDLLLAGASDEELVLLVVTD